MTTPDILAFSDPRAADVAHTGGKGASLARNKGLGLPVPDGFVVTAQAFRSFAAGSLDLSGLAADATPDTIETWAASRRTALSANALPEKLRAEIRARVGQWPEGTRFAVRSSGTMEDMAEAAFAGQHDTYLGLKGSQAVIDGVARCFASLFAGRAVAYRAERGFSQADAAMAVVIQEMIDAEAAGVAFTVDPIGGRMDRLVIESAFGLGEMVVSGEGETDQFILDKATASVVSSRIGHKAHAIRLSDDGTRSEETGAKADQPSLDAAMLAQVAKLALTVEARAAFPQDVEWAVAGGKAYLLQARPVTSIPERWTRDESAERFANPVTPLTWDLVETGFHVALRHSFEIMGLPAFQGRWFRLIDGYIYGNQNAVETYMGRPPFLPRSLDELRAALPVIRQKFAWMVELPGRWMLDLDSYLITIGALSSRPLAGLPLEELWQQVQRVNNVGRDYFRSNIAISVTQNLLNKALHYGVTLAVGAEKAPGILDALLAHIDTKTAAINTEIREMADLVPASPPLKAWYGRRRAMEMPEASALPDAFAKRFAKFIGDHGHRELDFDPYRSNWHDSPGAVHDAIGLALNASGHDNPREREAAARRRAREAEETLMGAVPEDLRFFFHELIRLARTYTSLDDLEHYQTSRLTIPMRDGLRAIGTRLMRHGVVKEAMDVFFATSKTLGEACEQPTLDRLAALRDEIEASKAAYLAACARDPVWEIGVAEEALTSADLTGVPGSPGKAEGVVRIVRSTDDFASFPAGAILVARTTNPAWTPLFHAARGVVVESGGPLSHGAVTAREMHIPAVMAVRGVLTALRDGDVVRVDGSAGAVEIVSRVA